MDMPKEFYDMVCADIKRLDNVRNLSAGELFELHRQIDARYQACINKWCDGLWCSTMMEHILLMDIWPRILKSMCYLI